MKIKMPINFKSRKTVFFFLLIAFTASFTSCLKDLDREPFNEVTSLEIYRNPSNYESLIAKVYAGFAVTGQAGPAGNSDLGDAIDEGFSQYLRVYWKLQEIPSDLAKVRWNDPGLPELNKWQWTSDNLWMRGAYLRFLYQITLANEFIKQTTDELMTERGFSAADAERIRAYRAEARFLKSLALYHAMDLFGNVADVTDENKFPGTVYPEQGNRAQYFDYIESELLEIENIIPTKSGSQYGRATRAAAQTLLAKLYLNAEVYIGQNKYAQALQNAEKVISSAEYSLEPKYTNLFRVGNDNSNEIIFPIISDGTRALSYGGTTFLINASGFPTTARFFGTDSVQFTAVGSSFPSRNIRDSTGSNGDWQGLIATKELIGKFPDTTLDSRWQFITFQRSGEISKFPDPAAGEGYVCKKFRNIDKDGNPGSNLQFSDTDFPLFRLADLYLIYAEASLRGGGGSGAQALDYVNQLRTRAYGNSNNNFTSLSLQDILDERARELYWEGHRRTDLIRYNQFAGSNYVWTWKGNTQNGAGAEDYRIIYPLPATELTANPNLSQNIGY